MRRRRVGNAGSKGLRRSPRRCWVTSTANRRCNSWRAREVAGADVAAVLLRAEETDDLIVSVISGYQGDAPSGTVVPAGQGLVGVVMKTGERIVTADPLHDPRYDEGGFIGGLAWPEMGPTMDLPLCMDNTLAGELVLVWDESREQAFVDTDVAMAEAFAEQAALALQAATAREDQSRLAVFEDRDRIGRDLHDLVIQRLFAIGLTLENVVRLSTRPEITNRVTVAVDDIDEIVKDIRRSIFGLGSGRASVTELRTELGRILDEEAIVLGFRPRFSTDGPIDSTVPDQVRPHLVAVVREALSNTARHAKASSVTVMCRVGKYVLLTVTDDGIGIADNVQVSGLRNMRERAEALGGTFEAVRVPERGTRGVCGQCRCPDRVDVWFVHHQSARHKGSVTLVPHDAGPMAGAGRHGPAYRAVVETSTFPCVGAVMSAPVVVVRDFDSIWHAIDRFTTTGLHHLVVLDNDDHLVGILDDRQALALWPFDAAGMHPHTIGELMPTSIGDKAVTGASVQPDVSAHVAGRLMLAQRVDALAVVDEFGRVVGILTGSDLIHHLVNALEKSDSPK